MANIITIPLFHLAYRWLQHADGGWMRSGVHHDSTRLHHLLNMQMSLYACIIGRDVMRSVNEKIRDDGTAPALQR